MKRKILLLCTVVLLFAILSAGSLAYVTKTETVHNVITTGAMELQLQQTGADGKAYSDGPLEIMPGDTVVNRTAVTNSGAHPFWVRVQVKKAVKDSTLSAEGMLLDLNNRNWTYKDGYYYYNQALQAGQTTEALFTKISFDGASIGNEYLGKLFTLDVNVYGVQSENNGTTVWEAFGWPEA